MENIYNWKVKPQVVVEKPPMYVSTHDPKLRPLGTCFGAQGTVRVDGANLARSQSRRMGEGKRADATFGKAKGSYRNNPSNYCRAGETKHTQTTKPGQAASKFTRPREAQRPKVPRREDRPVYGLKSGKNFVVANAVENILRAPAGWYEPGVRYVDKEDYGQVPEYLEQVKDDIASEKQMLMEMFEEQRAAAEEQGYRDGGGTGAPPRALPEPERKALLRKLKARWADANKEYQKMAHMVELDTISKKELKEKLESNLDEIEAAIKSLARPGVVVGED